MLTIPICEQLEPRLLLNGTPGAVTPDLPAQQEPAAPAAQFVRAEGLGFRLGDDPFYAPGTNIYYLLTYASDDDTRQYVDDVLEDAAAIGLKVVRTWAFCDGADQWQALQTAPGVYSESVFCGMDYVIYKAEQLGLRLILPLVNNLDDYGGMAQYIAWDAVYGSDPGEVATEHNDFYTDADTRQWYRDWVNAVINRRNTYTGVLYRDDPTIFAWELANEPRAPGDESGDILQAWLEEMAAYVKSLDPNHMLTTGSEGLYSHRSGDWMYDGSEGTDFIRNHQVEGIDFATIHLYPDQWRMDYDASLRWYQEHVDDARDTLRMPLLLEEFAVGVRGTGSRAQRDELYAGLLDLADRTDSAGWNFWMLAHDGYNHGRYVIHLLDDDDASTVDIITEAAARMNARSAGPAEPTEPTVPAQPAPSTSASPARTDLPNATGAAAVPQAPAEPQ